MHDAVEEATFMVKDEEEDPKQIYDGEDWLPVVKELLVKILRLEKESDEYYNRWVDATAILDGSGNPPVINGNEHQDIHGY